MQYRSAIVAPSANDPTGTLGMDMSANPLTLGNRKARLIGNMMWENGVLRTRFGFNYQKLGTSGQFQGALHYSPSKGLSAKPFAPKNTALVLVTKGRLFVTDTTHGTVSCVVRPVCGEHDFRCKGPVHLFQAENWLIVQNELSNTYFWPGHGCLLESAGLLSELVDTDPELGKAPPPTRGRCWSVNTFLQVTVIDRVTRKPIVNALINLNYGGRTDFTGRTNAYGEMIFYPVPKTYSMVTSAAGGYEPNTRDVVIVENETNYITVALSKSSVVEPFLGLQVMLRYDGGDVDPCDPGHCCNSAIYRVFANDVLLGIANLNNYVDCGTRVANFTITPDQSEEIAANSPDGETLGLRFECAPDQPGFDLSTYGGGCHPVVGHLIIRNLANTVLFDGCPDGATIDIDVNPAP